MDSLRRDRFAKDEKRASARQINRVDELPESRLAAAAFTGDRDSTSIRQAETYVFEHRYRV